VIRCIDVDGLEKLTVTISKDRFGRVKSVMLEGIRDVDVKNGVDINLKFANKKDVTTRDVLIVTRQEGKSDQLSFDDLNDTYRNQIKNAPASEADITDNSVPIPEGSDGAIQQDIVYNKGKLYGAASYDDKKYEFFYSEKKFKLKPPTTVKGDLYMYGMDIFDFHSDVDIVDKKVAEFDKANPDINSKFIEVTITGGASAKENLNTIKGALEAKHKDKIKVNVVVDKNFKPKPPVDSKSVRDRKLDIKISGVHL